MKAIIVPMRVFALVLLVSISFGVSKDWIEGYRAGREDERREIIEEIRRYRELLEALLNYKRFLLAGVIPAPLVIEKARIIKKEDGTLVVRKEIEIVPPDRIDLSVLKKLKVDLTKHMTIETGYWLFMKTDDFPEYEIAYYRHLGRKAGLNPFIIENMLVFGIYSKESEAIRDKLVLERLGVPELNVAWIEKEDF